MTNLNEQQQAVVDWIVRGSGSLNLIARAGCGKTFTLVRGAIRAIVENNLGELAIMAYNKSAGDEFKDRIAAMAKEAASEGNRSLSANLGDWRKVQAGTVHSFGFGAVRKWSPGVKVDAKKVQTILTNLAGGDATSIYATESAPILQLVSLAKQSAFGFSTGIDNRGAWYNLAEHHAVNDMTDDATIDEVIEASIVVLRASIRLDRDVVDFDDMVLAPLVHNIRMWPKDWILIDEAQDTNAARRALALKMLKPRTGRLIAVGDDRQAIYGFTGADSDSLDLIARELSSKTLPLTITYRCPKAVVAEANRLVPDLVAHETAPEGVVRRSADACEDAHGAVVRWFQVETPGPQDAALCRNTKPLVDTAYAMLGAGIGCRVEGREIGEGLVKLATRWKRVHTLQALEDKLVEYRDRETQKWQAKGREDRAQAAEDKVEALLSINRSLVKDGKNDVQDLVDWIRSLFGDTQPGEIPNVVTLSTIHKSKGREWDRVFLLYRSTTLPSKWARKPWQMDQETNLEYVAITRAKRELIFVD